MSGRQTGEFFKFAIFMQYFDNLAEMNERTPTQNVWLIANGKMLACDTSEKRKNRNVLFTCIFGG